MRVARLNHPAIADLAKAPKLRPAIRKVAVDVATDARRLAPRHHGDLRKSIKAVPDPEKQNTFRVVLAWDGIFPEFGTQDYPATPFMRPAADRYRRSS